MATGKIAKKFRYWPEGLDVVGAAGPSMVFVRGNRELLECQAVLLYGSRHAISQGVFKALEITRGVSNTDVVVAGDFENLGT